MRSEIERIVDQLQREHDGDPWHGSPLTALLQGLTFEAAAAHPVRDAHSVWEIVLHMTAWKDEVRRRLSGAAAGTPREGDWPEVAAASAEAWRAALDRLHDAHLALIASIRELPEGRLFEPTRDPRNRETGEGVSHYVLLHGVVQHDVYHSGQIALLKQAMVR